MRLDERRGLVEIRWEGNRAMTQAKAGPEPASGGCKHGVGWNYPCVACTREYDAAREPILPNHSGPGQCRLCRYPDCKCRAALIERESWLESLDDAGEWGE